MNHDLNKIIEAKAEGNPGYAVAYALLQLAEAQSRCATQLKYLGVGDAASTMGAVEFLAVRLGEKIGDLAAAVRETIDE